MIFAETKLKGAFIIDLDRRLDEQGVWRAPCESEFRGHGLRPVLAEANIASNMRKGALVACKAGGIQRLGFARVDAILPASIKKEIKAQIEEIRSWGRTLQCPSESSCRGPRRVGV